MSPTLSLRSACQQKILYTSNFFLQIPPGAAVHYMYVLFVLNFVSAHFVSGSSQTLFEFRWCGGRCVVKVHLCVCLVKFALVMVFQYM